MLNGKNVILGVTGSIAAYKAANVASMLVKLHANVHVIMTKNAANFIHPCTFETLTGNRCIIDTFDPDTGLHVPHIALAEMADLCLIAPASANMIAKLAHGLADDMLSTTVLAMKCPVLISPAMNTNMFMNPLVQENLKKLADQGKMVIQPAEGRLACGATGTGKMPSEDVLVDHVLMEIACEKDLKGLKLLVTAGPTIEPIDPVRFISNHSTGKMGYAIARRAMLRGALVTLISGPCHIDTPPFVKLIRVNTAAEMAAAVKDHYSSQDILIKSAAVADYTPAETASEKIKKSNQDLSLHLKRTEDILSWLGSHKKAGQILCGFSMETENVVENSRKKLEKKGTDLIAANSLREAGSGFAADTNHLILIEKDHLQDFPMMDKADAADALLTRLKECYLSEKKEVHDDLCD